MRTAFLVFVEARLGAKYLSITRHMLRELNEAIKLVMLYSVRFKARSYLLVFKNRSWISLGFLNRKA